MTIATTGRFGHCATNPALDFRREVDLLAGRMADRRSGIAHHRDLEERVKKALEFPASSIEGCAAAMVRLRALDETLAAEAEAMAA